MPCAGHYVGNCTCRGDSNSPTWSEPTSRRYQGSWTHVDDGLCRPTRCPWNGCEPVWFVRHNGGCVWLDELGWPWPVHSCWLESIAVNERESDGSRFLRGIGDHQPYSGDLAGIVVNVQGQLRDVSGGADWRPTHLLRYLAPRRYWGATLTVKFATGRNVTVVMNNLNTIEDLEGALVAASADWSRILIFRADGSWCPAQLFRDPRVIRRPRVPSNE